MKVDKVKAKAFEVKKGKKKRQCLHRSLLCLCGIYHGFVQGLEMRKTLWLKYILEKRRLWTSFYRNQVIYVCSQLFSFVEGSSSAKASIVNDRRNNVIM